MILKYSGITASVHTESCVKLLIATRSRQTPSGGKKKKKKKEKVLNLSPFHAWFIDSVSLEKKIDLTFFLYPNN